MSLKRFFAAQRGNISIIMAFTLLPVLVASGIAIDLERQVILKSQFDGIADTVALAAVDYTAMQQPLAQAQTAATTNFNNLASANSYATISSLNIAVNTVSDGRQAKVSYTVSIPPTFSSLIGTKSLSVSGSSTAHSANYTYVDVYVLADNTPSMGMGATTADITKLQQLTANNTAPGSSNCGFACHDLLTQSSPYGAAYNNAQENTYALVAPNGITMRIDSVRNAINSMLTTAAALPPQVQNNMRFAIYDFGAKAENQGLTQIFALNGSIANAKTSINAPNFDLMTVPALAYNWGAQTQFSSIFNSLNAAIPNAGDGTTQAAAKKLVVFVSDGMEDGIDTVCNGARSPNAPSYDTNRCFAPIDPTLCSQLKTRGIVVAAIYTTYLPNNGGLYPTISNAGLNNGPYSPSPNSLIAQGMQACASTGYYQEVGPNDSIANTMNQMFKQFLNQYARITG